MEKIFGLLLSCVLLSLGCNDNDIAIVTPETLYTVEVGSNIYDQEVGRTGHIYLTDFEGELLADTSLFNDNSYIIERDYDYTENSYDATFVTKFDIAPTESTVYNISTFIDVSPMTISLLEDDFDPNPNNERARFTILNIGSPSSVDLFFSNNTHTSSCTTADGGYCNFNVSLLRVPDNIYSTFNRSGEDFNRYLWLENVTGATADTFEFADIPIITESESIAYPPHDFVNTTLFGYSIDEPQTYYRLTRHSLGSEEMESEHPFPKNIFDGYKVDVLLSSGDLTYFSSRKYSDVVNTYALPAMELEITNNSLTNYEIRTSNDVDYYSVQLSYSNADEALLINWIIYGQGEQFMNFSLPNLADIIFAEHPNFSVTDLDHSRTYLYRIEGISSYEDYIHTIISPDSEASDQIERYEFVSKE